MYKTHFDDNILNEPKDLFCILLNVFTYIFLIQIISFTVNHLDAHRCFSLLLCDS